MIPRQRSTQSLNVLSCKPYNLPNNKPTKAKKFFQQSQLPKSLNNDLMLSLNNPEINGHPAKPLDCQVEPPDENDPFFQIERVTNKIGNLVNDYEQQAQADHYAMLQELDTSFQINNYDPNEILDESKKAVDGLMNNSKTLRETQVGMLGDLSTWFSREEQSLKDATKTSNLAIDSTMPTTTDDLRDLLNSSVGANQEMVSKAIALHGDIVSKAFITIHELERKNAEQDKTINDLKHQLLQHGSRHSKKSQNHNNGDTQKQLQNALSRISSQDDTIKSLNARIEQLIGQSVMNGIDPGVSDSEDAAALAKMHDVYSMEMQISKQTSQISALQDEIYKLKSDLRSRDGDKSILDMQILSLQEKAELERQRYETLNKRYLQMVNEQEDKKNEEGGKKNENPLASQVVQLESECQQLREQIETEKKLANQTMEKRIQELKKEFEVRELELRNRQFDFPANMSSDYAQLFDALKKQHAEEISMLQKDHNAEITELNKTFNDQKKIIEAENEKKMKEMQKELTNSISANSADAGKLLDKLTAQHEEKEMELKRSFLEKLDQQREDFQKHFRALEEEIAKKNDTIKQLMSRNAISDDTSDDDDDHEEDENDEDLIISTRPGNEKYKIMLQQQKEKLEKFWMQKMKEADKKLSDEMDQKQLQSESIINELNTKIANLDSELKSLNDNFNSEKEAAVEQVKSEFIEQINSYKELEGVNSKLTIENELLRTQVANIFGDFSINELANQLADQTTELNYVKKQLKRYQDEVKEKEDAIAQITAQNNYLLKKARGELRVMEYVYQEQFVIREPLRENAPKLEESFAHQFFMCYEITTSIEPRLQEHMKRLKNKVSIDNDSTVHIVHNHDISLEVSTPTHIIDMIHSFDDSSNQRHQAQTKTKNKLYISPIKLFAINDDYQQKLQLLTKHKELLFMEEPRHKAFTLESPMALNIRQAMSPGKEKSHLGNSVVLSMLQNESLFVGNEKTAPMNVAVQVTLDDLPPIPLHRQLAFQPTVEVFSLSNDSTITPEEPTVLEPSLELDLGAKTKENKRYSLLTSSGDLIDIPPVNSIDQNTSIEAANAASKLAIQNTQEMTNRLQIVATELQSINNEPDPVKRMQLQDTIGVQLDVEKDSLISQMRERITELEQMMDRIFEKQRETISISENHIHLESSSIQAVETSSDDHIQLTKGKSNQLMTSEIFEVETNLSVKTETLTITLPSFELNIEDSSTNLDLSSPKSILEMPETKDLSTDLGIKINTSNSEKKSLEIAENYSHQYNTVRSLERTETDEMFSQKPKTKINLFITEKVSIEKGEIQTNERSCSPYVIERKDVGVSNSNEKVLEGKQITMDSNENGSRRVKLNMDKVRTASRNVINPIRSIYSNKLFDIEPADRKADPRNRQLQTQAEQISALKKQILQLQFASNDEIHQVISVVNDTMANITENIDEMEKESGNVLIPNPSNHEQITDLQHQSDQSTRLLKEAIETTSEITFSIFDDQINLIDNQNSLFNRINDATKTFLNDMNKPGGATTETQSRFLRQINSISEEFADTLSALQAIAANDESVKIALKKAKEQVSEQEKFIEALQQEILNLKIGVGKSQLVKQLTDIRHELENLINDKESENKVLKNKEEAQKVIPKIALKGKNNNNVRQAGASLILERIANLSKPQNDNIENDWKNISILLGEAIQMIDENDAHLKARKMIDDLNLQIRNLNNDNQKLQTDLIVAQRDLQVNNEKYSAHISSLQRSLETANEHTMMLERQLSALQEIQSSQKVEAKVTILNNELSIMRSTEQKRLEEITKLNTTITSLNTENQKLTEELDKIKDRYQMLFNQCSDTQTINDALKSKTEEILQQSEIAQQRAQAYEKMSDNASDQADELARQLSMMHTDKSNLENELTQAQLKIHQLENLVHNYESQQLLSENVDIETTTTKVIKAYQHRIDDYMTTLTKHANSLITLRARHADDQKHLLMIQRENKKGQNQLKLIQIRYDCSKKENSLLMKTIANRDETIRMLKREIERLRSLLKVQGPLKQKIALFEKEKNNAEIAVIKTEKEVQKTKEQKQKFSKVNPNVANYYEGILQRQQATLARLETKRQQIREIEEKNKLAILRSVSHVVQMSELNIPEEVIFRLMPKPQPSQKVQQKMQLQEMHKMKSQIEEEAMRNDANLPPSPQPTEFETLNTFASPFSGMNQLNLTSNYSTTLNQQTQQKYSKHPSYADTLQMIGNLVGQKSPRTLHEMMRNARQNQIMQPMKQQLPPHRRNDTKSILTVKPLRK